MHELYQTVSNRSDTCSRRKAQITESLCIDCGECIRICPYKAKKPIFDKFEDISRFKYKIALPAPALFGQFDNMDDVDYVLDGLLRIGFDDVFEVSRAAEIVTEFTRKYMEKRDASDPPVISSACPVIGPSDCDAVSLSL